MYQELEVKSVNQHIREISNAVLAISRSVTVHSLTTRPAGVEQNLKALTKRACWVHYQFKGNTAAYHLYREVRSISIASLIEMCRKRELKMREENARLAEAVKIRTERSYVPAPAINSKPSKGSFGKGAGNMPEGFYNNYGIAIGD